mgnify:CR=1 FL=1
MHFYTNKYLIELEKHENGHEVHEGGVELEGDFSWTYVVTAGHHTLKVKVVVI